MQSGWGCVNSFFFLSWNAGTNGAAKQNSNYCSVGKIKIRKKFNSVDSAVSMVVLIQILFNPSIDHYVLLLLWETV